MEITFGAQQPQTRVGKAALATWSAGTSLAGMACFAGGCVGASMGGSVALGAALVVAGAALPMIASGKIAAAWESRLRRQVNERIEHVEQAAARAGISPQDAVVGVTQRYRVMQEYGPDSYRYEQFEMSLDKLSKWRQEHQEKREGLWISKKSEQEALVKIGPPKR